MGKKNTAHRPATPWLEYVQTRDKRRVKNTAYDPKHPRAKKEKKSKRGAPPKVTANPGRGKPEYNREKIDAASIDEISGIMISRSISQSDDFGFNVYDYHNEKLRDCDESGISWSVKSWRNLEGVKDIESYLTAGDIEGAQEVYDSIERGSWKSPNSWPYKHTDSERQSELYRLGGLMIKQHEFENTDWPVSEKQPRNDRVDGLGAAMEEWFDKENYMYTRDGEPMYFTKEHLNGAIDDYIAGNIPDIGNEDVSYLLPDRQRAAHVFNESSQFNLAMAFPNMELKDAMEKADMRDVKATPFLNMREAGIAYTVQQPDGNTRTFSVYEHRNTDSIIINGTENWDGESLPYAGDSKNIFFAEFAPDDRKQAADALVMFMKDAQNGELDSTHELASKAQHRDWDAILRSNPVFGSAYGEFSDKHYGKREEMTDESILGKLDFD